MLDGVADLFHPYVRSGVYVGTSSHARGMEVSPTRGDRSINLVADERGVGEGSELCQGENAVSSFFRIVIRTPGAILML